MDGVHDLGGMHGFGRVEREENEPVFHAHWEAAVLAMQRWVRGRDIVTLDEFRHAIERMAPADYLGSSYYARWLDALDRVLVEKGVVTADEVERRMAFFEARPDAPASAPLTAPPPPASPPRRLDSESSFREGTGHHPRFKEGDPVVARNTHPPGHTRLPRYTRGKRGVIAARRGVHVLPDANAHGLGERPEPLYTVRFEARELWGESAEPNQHVYVDLWESYLLPG